MTVKYGNVVIAVATNLQSCVCLSSTEAEFVAPGEAFKKVVMLKNALKKLKVSRAGPWKFKKKQRLYRSGTRWTSKMLQQKRTLMQKHNYDMSMVNSKQIWLAPVHKTIMEANFLTKALPSSELNRSLQLLENLISRYLRWSTWDQMNLSWMPYRIFNNH